MIEWLIALFAIENNNADKRALHNRICKLEAKLSPPPPQRKPSNSDKLCLSQPVIYTPWNKRRVKKLVKRQTPALIIGSAILLYLNG